MAEPAKVTQKPGYAQQLEPIFTDMRLSRRSLRSQPRPTPPKPDLTQDSLQLSSPPPELNNVLTFRRAGTP